LESQTALSSLLERARRAIQCPTYPQENRTGLGGAIQISDVRGHQYRFPEEEFPPLEPGAMCFMLSKQGYLNDADGHWRPHLMFFVPLTEPASWGAGLPGSPVVVAFTDTPERHTFFLVPFAKWSQGTRPPPTVNEPDM
jgi:hypothetical protein